MESLLPSVFQTDADGNVLLHMSREQFFYLSDTLKGIEEARREKARCDSMALKDLFDRFISNYEILSKNSKANYRQQFNNLLKWGATEGRNLSIAGDISKEVAEKYIRYAYSIKKTAKFEIRTLRRIWNNVFPDSYPNPWIHKLHLATFIPKKNMSHRPFKRKEIRQILTLLDSIIEFKKRDAASPERTAARRKKRLFFFSAYSLGFVQDMRDAVVFAVTYGMRMGSVASLKWSDFKKFSHASFFYHLPPKTARSKPVPLELPYLPQIQEILKRRRPQNINAAYKKGERLFKDFSALYDKSSCTLSGVFSRVIDKLKLKDSSIGIAAFHSFRTSFVSYMDEVATPKMITDSVTGHSSKEMHYIYSKPSPSAKKKWISKAYGKFDFSVKFNEDLIAEFETMEEDKEDVLLSMIEMGDEGFLETAVIT